MISLSFCALTLLALASSADMRDGEQHLLSQTEQVTAAGQSEKRMTLGGRVQPTSESLASSPSVAASADAITLEEALELCFPKATIKRGTFFFDKKEVARIEELSGVKGSRAIGHPYEAFDAEGKLIGTAWFDSRMVRSKKQTLMVAADPNGKILRVEVLAWLEPKQYQPPGKWFAQLVGKKLGPELALDGEVRNLSGATLSARASIYSARLVLARQKVLSERKAAAGPILHPIDLE